MALDGKNKILVNTLQDIGATESLIVESMLPFLTDTTTGGKSPVLGIWLVPLWVPLHHFQLFHDLLCGEVEMGVCPQLPVQGVDIILGNDLAGARVWKDGPPLLCVGSPLQESEEPDESAKKHPEVVSSCAVTWARSKAESAVQGV